MKRYAIGVDVGGTSVKLGLFSSEGSLLDKWEIPTRTEQNGAFILADIAASIERELAEKQIAPEEVAGIGLGVPGPVDSASTVHKCINLGWGVFNLKEEMNRLLPAIPHVAAGNDANVATLGELWRGGGKGYGSAVMFTLGTGVGGGMSRAGTLLTDVLAAYYRKYAFHVSADTPIMLATLGNDAGIYGCARMALSL